ncbi:hypothetical protein M0R45_036742 [Rubus argutus]|uniref:Uncharacterized protein n=1 Tax=Rubus argutus TaxID=59490 RepID=A0AAW1VWZ4_RUBAR
MQIRPAYHGALLGLCLCLFTSSFCYGDDKTIEVAGEPNKVFTEFKTTEAVELNEEGKFAVLTPKSFFKKPLLHKVPIVKKPFPPKPYFKKPPLHKIPIVKKPLPSPVPDIKIPAIRFPPIRWPIRPPIPRPIVRPRRPPIRHSPPPPIR